MVPFIGKNIKENHFKLEKQSLQNVNSVKTKVIVSNLRKEESFFMKGNYFLPSPNKERLSF